MPAPLPPIYVFEDSQVDRLYPLTLSRAACELRVGSMTLLERLQKNLGAPIAGVLTRQSLADVMRTRVSLPVNPALSTKGGVLLINGRLLLLGSDAKAITSQWRASDSCGLVQGTVVWMWLSAELAGVVDLAKLHEPRAFDRALEQVQRTAATAAVIHRPWDLFEFQKAAIAEDFAALGSANDATLLAGPTSVHLLAKENIHLAKGVKLWPGVVIDAQTGPVIIQEGAEIRANAVLTGPLVVGPHCLVRTAADLREECILGPNSRVGGELSGVIFLGNGNKQHLGFLGQSIIGEWANLGAGTTTSNLKNTYGTVKMPLNGEDEPSGRLFLGSIVADHAKLGIGTYLSTGSVVGFGSHVVVPRPPRFVPSFAWLTEKGMHRAEFEKIEQIAATVMKRRGIQFSPADHELFVRIASEWSLGEKFAWPNSAPGSGEIPELSPADGDRAT